MTPRSTIASSSWTTAALGMLVVGGALDPALAADANVVVLTQTPCQFLESESGVDRKFRSRRAEDCEAVNQRTGAARIAEATPLQLKPGRYVFRVTNKNVPYELGFWLREHDYSLSNPLHKVTKISVSGGGLALGTTKDYVVDLKPGQYVYSCPLNPTPNYRLVVRE